MTTLTASVPASATLPIVTTQLHDLPCPDEGHCDGCPWQDVGGYCEQPSTKRLFITNAFSLQMLSSDSFWMDDRLAIRRLTDEEAQRLLQVCSDAGYRLVSGVGHADTARVLSGILGTEVPMNRVSVDLGGSDLLLVGQYSGPRLPEGATKLPEGASIRWFTVQDISWKSYKDQMQWKGEPDPNRPGRALPSRTKKEDFVIS